MGKDEEALGRDAFDHRVGDHLRLERSRREEIDPETLALGFEHVGLHALRAKARDANSFVAMHDGKPLEEGECSRFRHAIRRGEKMVEQTGCGHSADDVAVLPRKHRGQHVSGHVDVSHQIDFPDPLPVVIRCFGSTAHCDAGVRAEDIDAPVL